MTIDLISANIIVGMASFVQTSVGIGFAMIAVPLLMLIDLNYAPGPSLFAMLFLSCFMVLSAWRDVDRRGLAALVPGLIAGTLAGTAMLGAIPPSAFGLVFGSLVLAALLIGQFGLVPHRSNVVFGTGGFVAGLMGTMSGIHGPPLTVLYQRADPARARATIAFIFVLGSSLSLASLHQENLFGKAQIHAGLTLLPGLIAGLLLARFGRDIISDQFARRMMLVLAGTSSATLIAKSIF